MNKTSTTKYFGTNIGTPSILLIFVLLCLVSFASLSIVTSNADHKLSKKILTRSSAYYEACNKAEESLALLDRTLLTLYESGITREEYFLATGYEASYLIPISELQSLMVEVSILYPTREDASFYSLKSYRVVTTGQLEYDESLSVIQ